MSEKLEQFEAKQSFIVEMAELKYKVLKEECINIDHMSSELRELLVDCIDKAIEEERQKLIHTLEPKTEDFDAFLTAKEGCMIASDFNDFNGRLDDCKDLTDFTFIVHPLMYDIIRKNIDEDPYKLWCLGFSIDDSNTLTYKTVDFIKTKAINKDNIILKWKSTN